MVREGGCVRFDAVVDPKDRVPSLSWFAALSNDRSSVEPRPELPFRVSDSPRRCAIYHQEVYGAIETHVLW